MITSHPELARTLLGYPHFADRSGKQSAQPFIFGMSMTLRPTVITGDSKEMIFAAQTRALFT